MTGETMLRVGNVGSEDDLEIVRDALDQVGAEYEHVSSEPEDYYPQTAYFYVSSDLSDDIDNMLYRLSEEHGFDVELL
jgi:hypothetical protein